MKNEFATYEEFWPFYVAEHRRPLTRRLHFLGTSLVFIFLILGFVVNPWFFLAMPIAGYGFAWASHFFVEKNRPATFRHPLWSLRADFHMFFLMCRGRMDEEVRRVG